MSKHTPGPWKVHDVSEFLGDIPSDADFMIEFGPGDWGGFWVVGHNRINRDSSKRTDPLADARLIATAPELLEACQDLLEMSRDSSWAHITNGPCVCKGCSINKAKAVVAKATGNTSTTHTRN